MYGNGARNCGSPGPGVRAALPVSWSCSRWLVEPTWLTVRTELAPHWRWKPRLYWSEYGFLRRGSRNPLPWPNGSGAGVIVPFPKPRGLVAMALGEGLFKSQAARKATFGQL